MLCFSFVFVAGLDGYVFILFFFPTSFSVNVERVFVDSL